jgi:transposase
MSNGAVEIIGGRERRRRWGLEEKLRIVAESHQPDACVREVAARHDLYPSLLHNWRRQVRDGRLAAPWPASFVPVRVSATAPITAETSPRVSERQATDRIEIVLPDGLRVHVGDEVSLAVLRRVMTVLRG